VAPPLAGRLGASRDLVENHLAVLAPRILVGDDDEPRPLTGDTAHHRPLVGVALPGRAEHRDQAATTSGGSRGKDVEDRGERGRTVGVVDHDPEWLTRVDPLHPPGNPFDRLEAGPDRGRIELEAFAERDDRKRVVDVEATSQPETEPRGAGRRLVVDLEAVGGFCAARRADVRGGVRAVGQDSRAGFLGNADERPGVRIVGVDDRRSGPAGALLRGVAVADRESLEQR
jgi:hypothetical protein